MTLGLSRRGTPPWRQSKPLVVIGEHRHVLTSPPMSFGPLLGEFAADRHGQVVEVAAQHMWRPPFPHRPDISARSCQGSVPTPTHARNLQPDYGFLCVAWLASMPCMIFPAGTSRSMALFGAGLGDAGCLPSLRTCLRISRSRKAAPAVANRHYELDSPPRSGRDRPTALAGEREQSAWRWKGHRWRAVWKRLSWISSAASRTRIGRVGLDRALAGAIGGYVCLDRASSAPRKAAYDPASAPHARRRRTRSRPLKER